MKKLLLSLILFTYATIAVAQDAVFETDVLNAGLPQAGDDADLSTPQSAMETILFAAESEEFDVAAQVLNLNDIDVPVQAERGPILAERLAVVLDRKVVISWQALLERPDSLNANGSSEDVMAGQPRKKPFAGGAGTRRQGRRGAAEPDQA